MLMRAEPGRVPVERFVPPVRRGGAWKMAARVLTAVLGGYAASAALATLLARLLPVERVEAALWGLISAFVVYTAILLWCFREPRLTRVALVVWGVAIVGGAAARALGVRP